MTLTWYTIEQASRLLACSTRKMRVMITEGEFGRIGTVRDSLPVRDLNPSGAHRQYRLHCSLFEAGAPRNAQDRLPDKGPKPQRLMVGVGEFGNFYREKYGGKR